MRTHASTFNRKRFAWHKQVYQNANKPSRTRRVTVVSFMPGTNRDASPAYHASCGIQWHHSCTESCLQSHEQTDMDLSTMIKLTGGIIHDKIARRETWNPSRSAAEHRQNCTSRAKQAWTKLMQDKKKQMKKKSKGGCSQKPIFDRSDSRRRIQHGNRLPQHFVGNDDPLGDGKVAFDVIVDWW